MVICKLCREEKPLIKKSHIFPNFLYDDFYDEHHRIRKFNLHEMTKLNPRVSKPPTGIYEGGILCAKCDNEIFGSYETHLSLLIKGKKKTRVSGIKIKDNMTVFKISNIDSQNLKLFLLSILFRASISSQPEFSDVSLGPYEEKIRLALLNRDLSDVNIQISILKFAKSSNFTRFMAQPIRSKIDNTTVYSIIINGYLIIYFLKENRMSKSLFDFRVQDTDILEILQIPKQQVEKFILNIIGNRIKR